MKLFFFMNSHSTLQVCMKFAFIVSGLVFLQSYWISNNVSQQFRNVVWLIYWVDSPHNNINKLTCTNNCRMNRIHRPPWCELPEPSPDRNWSCCIQSCPSQQFRNVIRLIYWVDSPIAAKYIWALRLFHTLPDLPLDWSYHRDLENFDEVAILPVKKTFFKNFMYRISLISILPLIMYPLE